MYVRESWGKAGWLRNALSQLLIGRQYIQVNVPNALTSLLITFVYVWYKVTEFGSG